MAAAEPTAEGMQTAREVLRHRPELAAGTDVEALVRRLATFAAPTHMVPVARMNDAGELEGITIRWGLIPSWAKDKKNSQINARADTAATKPMFRTAFKKRRCLILADGYYEWKKLGPKQKQPYLYRMKDERSFAFAGLWETWQDEGKPLDTCTILTTDANELAAEVHDRMPVLLDGAEVLAWVDFKIPFAALPR